MDEGEGEEGRRRGRKGGEEIETRERGKGTREGIVSVAREKGDTRKCARSGEKEGEIPEEKERMRRREIEEGEEER